MLNMFLMTDEVGGFGTLLVQVVPLVLIFAVMYLVLIMPQKKKEKALKLKLAELKIGDDIVTIGGIMGKVAGIKDDVITIAVDSGADKGKMKVQRWAIKDITTLTN